MKAIILGLFLAIPGISYSQAPVTLSDPKPSFIALTVSNIDSSILWYQDNLGMLLQNKVDSRERGFKQANLIRAKMQIELVELDSSISVLSLEKHFSGKNIQGFTKFGFSVTDFDNWYSIMKNKNIKFVGRMIKDSLTGKRMFLVSDPDDNLIQIFEEK